MGERVMDDRGGRETAPQAVLPKGRSDRRPAGSGPQIDEKTHAILEHRRRTASIRRRGWLMRRMLVGADAIGLLLAFTCSYLSAMVADHAGIPLRTALLLFAATLPGWMVLAKMYGLYERDEERTEHTTADDLAGVFHLVTVGTWLFLALARLGGAKSPTVLQSVGFWAFAIFFVCVARVSARAVCRRQIAYLQNTVVLGAGEVGQMVARKFRKHPEYGINLVGFVDAEPTPMAPDLEGLSILGLPEDLPSIVRIFDIERVVIAFSQEEHEDTLALVRKLTDYEVQVDIVPRLFEVVGPNVDIHTVEGLPLVGLPPLRLSRSSLMLKRSIDIFASVVGLLLLTPLIAAIALAIKIDSPGPIFYRGERVGRNSRRFRLFKFRTMKLEYCRGDRYGGQSAEKEFERMLGDPLLREEFETTHKVGADPRVTRLGAFLRRSSLDELPQLLNVLTGDLSLVGPRPITSDEYDLLVGKRDSGGIAARLFARENEAVPAAYPLSGYWELEDLRPGITGYWQVTGRSAIGYDERVRLDLAYVKSWSLKLDSAILAKTLRTLISSRGAY